MRMTAMLARKFLDRRSQEEVRNSPNIIDDIRTVKEYWSVSHYIFSLYDLIAYRTRTPAPMACNTFLTVNFSVKDGGGSGKFDMILSDCTGEAERWCWDRD
jgi:hypothetical protein